MEKKDELIELADTINDTPVFTYDNTTPTYVNSKILDNSNKIVDDLYLNHFSSIEKNISTKNELNKGKKPENKILLQRENRRIISIINKIIKKKESLNTTKLSIKNLLINYRNDIAFLKDDKRNTLLHIYVEANDFNSLKIILDIYIDILKISKNFYYFLFSKNIEEKNVFDISVEKGQIPIIKLLYEQIEKENIFFEKKIYIQYIKHNIFHIAVKNNQIFPIIFFYEKLKIFYRNYYNEESILDSKEINNEKMAPIHYACKNKNVKLMNLLIDLGADINIKDRKGNTPLHYAVANNDERMVKHLLIRGANKFIKDENNITPYELSCLLGDTNLKEILYHKNCCQKQFCGEEIGPISKKNNMRFLFIGLIFTIFIKLIITLRFYFVIKNININFSFLFSLCNDDFLANNFNNKINNFVLNDFFSCIDDNCLIEIGIIFCTLFIDLLLLFNFFLFKCSKSIFLIQKKENEECLSSLFEENESKNICVKCRIVINEKTQHCLICDRCVENWDHHCFWLNTCINDKNYKKFRCFIISSILFLVGNLIFYNICNYLLFNSKDLFVHEIFNIHNENFPSKIIVIIFHCVCFYLIIIITYSLLFIVIPILKYICKKSKNNNKKKNKKDYKLIKNIIDNEDEDDIINVNSINKNK